VPAPAAPPSGVVLKEFHKAAAFRTLFIENGFGFPVAAILSWAFHVPSFLNLNSPLLAAQDKFKF
jgi:hypothetical protein